MARVDPFLALGIGEQYHANMRMVLRCNRKVVFSCKYHVVWCPKYRRKVLVDRVDERLKTIVRSTVAEQSGTVIEMEVMLDHVHLLVEVDPQFGIHRLVRLLKGRSSRRGAVQQVEW